MTERISTSEWRKASESEKARILKRVVKRRPVQREHMEQVELFCWARREAGKAPALAMMFAIPNAGRRTKAAGGKLKAEGMKAGVPDICLPVARGRYHGLFIELKVQGGRPTEAQHHWIQALAMQGYYAVICFGWEAAKETIEEYLAQ
jgi:hypothetical protein